MKQRAAEQQRLRAGKVSVAAAAAAPAFSETAKSGRSDRQAPLADGEADEKHSRGEYQAEWQHANVAKA